MAADHHDELLADEADLEAFVKQPVAQRQLTARLKGVLAETACTGVIRYKWPFIQPLLMHLMQLQLKEFEAAEHVDVGPARPLQSGDGSVAALSEQFATMLGAFQGPPWTLQRLCELLLEPRKQYQRLHKLALAIEKLLLVTGEVDVSPAPGPLPRLSQFTRINEAPPSAATAAATGVGQKRQRQEDSDAGGLVAAALTVRQQPGEAEQQQQAHTAAAAAEGPDGKPADEAAATAAMDVDSAPNNSDSKAHMPAVGQQTAAAILTAAPADDHDDSGREAATDMAHVTSASTYALDQPAQAAAEGSTDKAAVVS